MKRTVQHKLTMAALLVGAVLRFAVLDQKPLWSDELASVERCSELSFAAHVAAMRGNHPLYELLLRAWAPRCGGLTPLRPRLGDAMLRLPSAVFGTVTLLLVWLLARRILSPSAAAAAVWLFALSPLHVMFSRIGRPYALSVMLVAASNLAMWRVRERGGVWAWAAYGSATVLYLYANLAAGFIWIAQNAFMIFALRRERGRLVKWIAAQAVIGAVFLPWMIYSLPGAAEFGTDTVYRARQLGVFAKLLYLPFVFSVGETVHPLNLAIVPAAFVGFGGLFAAGARTLWRRRDEAALFLATQFVVVFVLGLFFAAAAPKHLSIILPAFCMILAAGVAGSGKKMKMPARKQVVRVSLRAALVVLAVVTSAGSLVNYFVDREFHDADMVTPWREIVEQVRTNEHKDDALIIGYRGDRGIWRMFRRYYRGRLDPVYLDFGDWQGQLGSALKGRPRVWLLLHDTDPREEIKKWLGERAAVVGRYQYEEHTLKGMREGLGSIRNYRSYLYKLYLVKRKSEPGA